MECLHDYGWTIPSEAGGLYAARVYGAQQAEGPWQAWFVFFPMQGGRAIATDRETTQSTREDVVYWAGGITPVYLEGALERALRLLPAARLERRMAEADREEALARVEAELYERAAEAARTMAQAALVERKAVAAALHDVAHEEPVRPKSGGATKSRPGRSAARRSSSRARKTS
ncbi:MAG: hypothetical protein LC804_28215 [Acidobacteria bacterium]|nr:hypothetical protein [Acidobacteriota bacterium]